MALGKTNTAPKKQEPAVEVWDVFPSSLASSSTMPVLLKNKQ